jgi:hypothetical protein
LLEEFSSDLQYSFGGLAISLQGGMSEQVKALAFQGWHDCITTMW